MRSVFVLNLIVEDTSSLEQSQLFSIESLETSSNARVRMTQFGYFDHVFVPFRKYIRYQLRYGLVVQ